MEQTILTKVQRFVELSTKFSKSESDLFPKNTFGQDGTLTFTTSGNVGLGLYSQSNAITVTGTFVLNGKEIFVDNQGNVRSKDSKPLTRAEKIEAEAKVQSILSDEFDEYLNLRKALTDYFNAINKVQEIGK